MSSVLNLCLERRYIYSGNWWSWGKMVESGVGSKEPLYSSGSSQGMSLSRKHMTPMNRNEQDLCWSALVRMIILKPKVKNTNRWRNELFKWHWKVTYRPVSLSLEYIFRWTRNHLITEAGWGSNLKCGTGQNVTQDRKSLKFGALRQQESNFSSRFSVVGQA